MMVFLKRHQLYSGGYFSSQMALLSEDVMFICLFIFFVLENSLCIGMHRS